MRGNKTAGYGEKRSGQLISLNPADLTEVGQVQITAPEDVKRVVDWARGVQTSWQETELEERLHILKRARDLLFRNVYALAELITQEMGKPIAESFSAEMEASLDLFDYYLRHAARWLKTQRVRLHNPVFRRRRCWNVIEPVGVFGLITPWNWPVLIPLGTIVPALLAGNAVVFKPSEYTPLVGRRLWEIFREAGLPSGVFEIVYGARETGEALVESGIDKIFFTGSTQVGRRVMAAAAKRLSQVVLELGGNDAAIVRKDADLDYTTSGLLWASFNNCGQNCNGAERIYVHEQVLPEFLDLFLQKIDKLRIGPGLHEETDLGPLATPHQREKIEKLVEKAIKRGAQLLCGGERPAGFSGYFYRPTVLLWKNIQEEPEGEEIFGPVACVVPVRNDEEAVRAANRSRYGLTASIWTRNTAEARKMARKLRTGTVLINDMVTSFGFPEAGWTGQKESGIGWVHGEKGFDEMVVIKFVTEEPQARTQKSWWFPYSEQVRTGMERAIRFLYSPNLWERVAALPGTVRNFAPYLLFNSRKREKL